MLKFYCYNFTGDKNTKEIISDIKILTERTAQFEREEEIMLFVFVPAVSLEAVCAAFPDRRLVKISCQSVSAAPVTDAFTPEKLRAVGADMAVTGLTDRRYYLGESSEKTGDDLEILLNAGFKAMLCVGETPEMAKSGEAKAEIERQLKAGYARIPYEAHYRIGTIYRPLWEFDHSFEAEEAYTLSMFETIRKTVREALPGFPIEMPLFYGGRLSEEKIREYFEKGLIDGVFFDSSDHPAEGFAELINTIG